MPNPASSAHRIAARFVAARRAGANLSAFPGEPPVSLADAYAIQAAAIGLEGRAVLGWKIGRIFPPASAEYGAERLAGPIFAGSVVRDAGDGNAPGFVFAGGFGAAEAEFLLRLGAAVRPEARRWSLEEAARQVVAVHVGIEIASSPLRTINELGPAVTAADFGNNNGLVVGAAIEGWRTFGFADWSVATFIDGAEAGRGVAAAFPDGPLGSLRFLLESCGQRGITLPEGCWVSTGAVSGVHGVAPGQAVEARFGDALTVRCRIAAVPAGEGEEGA